jgi:hypothetical protein
METVAAADDTRNLGAALEALTKVKNGSITEAFQRIAQGKVTYSHRQHTTTQARCVNFLRSPRKHVNIHQCRNREVGC